MEQYEEPPVEPKPSIGPLIIQVIVSALLSYFFAVYWCNNPDQNPSHVLGFDNPLT